MKKRWILGGRSARRMGWRLVRHYPARSCLLAFAVALPVAVGVGAAGVGATARTSATEFADAVFGEADALVREAPRPDEGGTLRYEDPAQENRRLQATLPEGIQGFWDLDLVTAIQVGDDRLSPQSRVIDLAEAVNAPIYRVDAGKPLSEAATLSLSSALAAALGIGLDDYVMVGPSRSPMRVTALISNRPDLTQLFAVIPPAAVLPGGPLSDTLRPTRADREGAGASRWRIIIPPDRSIAELEAALLDNGYEVQPRSLARELAAPTADAEALALAFALGLLAEVVLLISGAFAVVARSQRRQAALLAALGAPARVRRGVLVTYGLALGVTGALFGGGVGVLAAAGLVGPLARRAGADWGPFDPSLDAAGLLLACACAAAIIAAWWPARALASTDPLALLRETTPFERTWSSRSWRSVALLLGFATVSLVVSIAAQHPLPALGGALSGVVGTLFALNRGASKLTSRSLTALPAPIRVPVRALLALPGRTTTVVLALSVVMTLGIAVLIYVQTLADHQIRYHWYAIPRGATLIQTARSLNPPELQSLRSAHGVGQPIAFSDIGLGSGADWNPVLVRTPFAVCVDLARAQALTNDRPVVDLTHCGELGPGSDYPLLGVADVPDLERLLGRSLTPVERTAFEAGSALTLTASSTPGEDGDIQLGHLTGDSAASQRLNPLIQVSALSASDGQEYQQMPVAFVSPDTIAQLSPNAAAVTYSYLVLPGRDHHPPPPEQLLQALPSDVQQSASITVDDGPPLQKVLQRLLLSVTLGALSISAITIASAVGLWSADLRGDYLMLGAVGASASWRRWTGAWHGGLLSATAVAVGGTWGIAAIGAALARANSPSSFPWIWIATLLIGVLASAAFIGATLVPTAAQAARRAG